ncbi:hypothetical protein CFC21_023148 [Triticum aestivum]|uniref:Uncharacterized protein n=2 Tax=Triticum aestivum TaxID=4565 RepID=A0A9R1EEL3_WHEAT|nr:uncharacterized protein LOC123041215 [Triticum aestivum]KAF7008387.1 hypothetical protein CFC21_023148 [Triticum aestivum]
MAPTTPPIQRVTIRQIHPARHHLLLPRRPTTPPPRTTFFPFPLAPPQHHLQPPPLPSPTAPALASHRIGLSPSSHAWPASDPCIAAPPNHRVEGLLDPPRGRPPAASRRRMRLAGPSELGGHRRLSPPRSSTSSPHPAALYLGFFLSDHGPKFPTLALPWGSPLCPWPDAGRGVLGHHATPPLPSPSKAMRPFPAINGEVKGRSLGWSSSGVTLQFLFSFFINRFSCRWEWVVVSSPSWWPSTADSGDLMRATALRPLPAVPLAMPLLLLNPLNLCPPLHQRLLWPPTAPLQPKQFFRATPEALSSPMCRSPTTRPFLAAFYLGNASRHRLLLQSIPRHLQSSATTCVPMASFMQCGWARLAFYLVWTEGSLAA